MIENRCTLCKEDFPNTGQQVGPIWMLFGPNFRICKRCYNAAKDARLLQKEKDSKNASPTN